MNQVLWSPSFVTWPVYRNVNDEESSLGVGLKGICICFVKSNDVDMNQKRREEFLSWPTFSYRQKWVNNNDDDEEEEEDHDGDDGDKDNHNDYNNNTNCLKIHVCHTCRTSSQSSVFTQSAITNISVGPCSFTTEWLHTFYLSCNPVTLCEHESHSNWNHAMQFKAPAFFFSVGSDQQQKSWLRPFVLGW